MRFQIRHILISVTIVFVLIALSSKMPLVTLLLFFFVGGWQFAYFVGRRSPAPGEKEFEHPIVIPQAVVVLFACTMLVGIAFVLPINMEIKYAASGWRIEHWLYVQLLCYCFSMIILNASHIEAQVRFEFALVLTIVYICVIPILLFGRD